MKKGMHLPIMEQDHQLRLLSKWEIAKAYGLPGDLILPEPEGDAVLLLAQATIPALAIQVLGSVIAHRQENPMPGETLLRYLEAGVKSCKHGWSDFAISRQFAQNGWATMILAGAEAEAGPDGRLRSRMRALQRQLDALTDRRARPEPPLLPESVRTIYEELEQEEEHHLEHRLFYVGHGYSAISLNEEDAVVKIHNSIAQFLGVPASFLAVAKVDNRAGDMERWVLAGEMIQGMMEQALVLVDAGIPQAQWLPAETFHNNLIVTYQDQHSSLPDAVEVNGILVQQWPIALTSGDYIRLRWNGHSDHEDWKDLDVFDHMETNQEDMPEPPNTPPPERAESSPGGIADDPAASDTEPMPDTPPQGPTSDTPATAEEPPTRECHSRILELLQRHRHQRDQEHVPLPSTRRPWIQFLP